MVPFALCLLASFFMVVHLGTIAVAGWRCRPRRAPRHAGPLPAVTIVRPLCGREAFSEETLAAAFAVRYPEFELLFCVARPDDAVIPLVEQAIAAHPHVAARLLVGDDRIGLNPKLNNMVKGWRQARYEWIVFIDSNVLVPPDFILHAVGTFRDDTGVVSAPPCGTRPQNFGACLECAFLNTFEARWQYTVDTFGSGFAQGKTLFYRKADLDRSGMRDLATEPAEDAATTKMVRRDGKRVRLSHISPQPLGIRSCRETWDRQLRWARMRRATFPLEYMPEAIAGSVVPAIAVLAAAFALGWSLTLTLAAYLVLWYAAEWAMAAWCRWPHGPRVVIAMVLRDLLLPVLFIGAYTSSSFTWKGNLIRMEEETEPPHEVIAAPGNEAV